MTRKCSSRTSRNANVVSILEIRSQKDSRPLFRPESALGLRTRRALSSAQVAGRIRGSVGASQQNVGSDAGTVPGGVGSELWEVSKIEFNQEEHQLDLWLDFASCSRFACPLRGAACGVYETADRVWRHLNFFQHKTFLHTLQPRIECAEHGVKTAEAQQRCAGGDQQV